jgi:penicillin-binding protein 2
MSRQKWYAGETISVAIGQGAVTVSPLQIASALGGLGAGGEWFKPHLVKTEKAVLLRRASFNPENLQQVISGMYAVVNEGGTGRAGQLPNIKVCGKTGTAQVASTELTKGAKLKQALANNAWFIAFAPQASPEIVVAALYENGEESYNAVPIVRDVLKAYFDKKTRESESQITKLKPLIEPSIFATPRPIAALELALPAGLSQ